VLWATRREAARRATRPSNRLNNIVLRFGYTFGADCSMRSAEGEGILSDLIEGAVPSVPGVAPDGLPEAVRPLVNALLLDMKSALKEADHATSTAVKFVRARDWPTGKGKIPGTELLGLLRSVPGVGETTALTWLAEVTDPTRFDHAKQVAAYCGCDPSLQVSAGRVTSHTRRAGNARLHQALLYATSVVLRHPQTPLGPWGRPIAGRHKSGGRRKASRRGLSLPTSDEVLGGVVALVENERRFGRAPSGPRPRFEPALKPLQHLRKSFGVMAVALINIVKERQVPVGRAEERITDLAQVAAALPEQPGPPFPDARGIFDD